MLDDSGKGVSPNQSVEVDDYLENQISDSVNQSTVRANADAALDSQQTFVPVKVAQANTTLPPATTGPVTKVQPNAAGVVTLPDGTKVTTIQSSGSDLRIVLDDGRIFVIEGGATNPPSIQIGSQVFPAQSLAATFGPIEEVQPAAGNAPPSSGENFTPVSIVIDSSYAISPLLPPSELQFPQFQRREVGLNDDAPRVGDQVLVELDEDFVNSAYGFGNQDHDGTAGDDNGTHIYTGNLVYSFGANGANALEPISFDVTALNTLGLQSHGVDIVFAWDQATFTLTGTAGANVVIQLVVTNTQTGAFTVTLTGPLDHLPPTSGAFENDIVLDLPFTIKDGNGTPQSGVLQIRIDDDAPMVNASEPIKLTVNEDDILTLWSQGTSPNDGNADGSYTEGLFGPAISSSTGQLSAIVSFGADGPAPTTFSFVDNAADVMASAYHLFSKQTASSENGKELTYQVVGNVLTAYEPGPNGNPVFSLTLESNGDFTFRLYDELIHQAGNGENTTLRNGDGFVDFIDFGQIIKATDYDGDSVVLTGKVRVYVVDDVPEAHIVAVPLVQLVHDETPGLLNTAGQPDEAFYALFPGSAQAAFNGIANKGDDPDVAGSGAIGYARTLVPVVLDVSNIGADAPPYPHHFSLAIVGGSGVDSGLTLTDGSHINLVKEGDLIVGRVADQQGSVDYTGKAAFAIYIDDTGSLSLVQYLSLGHPDTTSHDEPVNLNGLVEAVLTVTDSDGDSDTASVEIGGKIVFEDDGPTLLAYLKLLGDVLHDETPGNQGGFLQPDDDTNPTSAILSVFASVNGGDDPDVAGTGPIGYARSDSLVGILVADFGSDGPGGSNNGIQYTFTIGNGGFSGLQTTEGKNIYLFDGGNNVIVGRYDADNNGIDANDPAAFAVHVDPNTGEMWVVQYMSLHHPNTSSHDETISMADGALSVTVTLTDGDGDTVSQNVDISGRVRFDDDGPKVDITAIANKPNIATLNLDETGGADRYNGAEAQDGNGGSDDTGNGFPIAPTTNYAGAVAIGSLSTNIAGGLNALFSTTINYGADGPANNGSEVDALTLTLSGNAKTNLIVTALDGTPLETMTIQQRQISLVLESPTTIIGVIPGKAASGDEFIAFRITILNPGDPANAQFKVDQFLAIDHDATGNNGAGTQNGAENPSLFDESKILSMISNGVVRLVLTTTVTDGDGDTATDSASVIIANSDGSFVHFDDDGPVIGQGNRDWTLDEDVLVPAAPEPAGNDALDVPQDFNDYTTITLNGTNLGIDWGSDGLKSLSFNTASPTVTDGNGNPLGGLSSGGVALQYVTVTNADGGQTLTAYKGAPAGGIVVFTITLDPDYSANGAFTFTLSNELDHPNGQGQNTLNLTFPFTAKDGDNDAASSTVVVRVTDDVPYILSNNYAANADFEGGNWGEVQWWGQLATSLTNWTISSSPVEGASQLQVERAPNGYLGMVNPFGDYMIDMAASPGNIQISQQVSGLTAGQPYAITFAAGAPFPETAALEVWFGGNLIATIQPTATMTPYSFIVTASGVAANDVLMFREVGTGNDPLPSPNVNEGYHGTYLGSVKVLLVNYVDEDGLPKGVGDNATGDNIVPNVDGDNNEATTIGNLHIAWGSDNSDIADAGGVQDGALGAALTGRAVYFSNAVVTVGGVALTGGIPVLTSHGDKVSYVLSENGTKLTGIADDGTGPRNVFVVSLSDDGTGQYKFVLLDQLDHAPGANENDITLGFNFTARDFDGDTATGSFVIGVDDDRPVATFGVIEGANVTVDESLGANAGENEVGSLGSVTVDSGVLFNGSINFGADGPAANNSVTYVLSIVGGNGTASGLIDTATGQSIVFFDNNGVIEGHVGSIAGALSFAISVAADGDITLTQYRAIYHSNPNDPDEAASPAVFNAETLSLTQTATDYDGDTAQNTINISTIFHFEDDGPTAGYAGRLTLNEDRNTSGIFVTQSISGIMSFVPGSDGAKITAINYDFYSGGTFKIADGDAPTFTTYPLTSNGDPVTVIQQAGANGPMLVGKLGDGTVIFTVEVTNPVTGAYTFTLLGPIDHPDLNESGAADLLRMKVSYTVTDGDGDTATGSVQLDIGDDAPIAVYSGRLTLAEDRDSGGNFVTSSINGVMSFDPGGDGAKITSLNYDFKSSGTFTIADGDAPTFTTYPLTSNGDPITVIQQAGANGPMLVGKLDDGTVIFTVEVTNPVTGAYTFTLLGPIDHPDVNESGAADLLRMRVSFTVTDADGDQSTGHVQLDVRDDAPVANFALNPYLTPVVVDESLGQNAGENETGSLGSVTVAAANLFVSNVDFGGDGPAAGGGVNYALTINGGNGTFSGLVDTLSGQNIVLVQNGSVIEGRTATGNDLSFSISVNGSGDITLTQFRAVVHNDPNDPDEAGASAAVLNANLILLTQTVTDYDLDQVANTVDITSVFRFEDDGPTLSLAPTNNLLNGLFFDGFTPNGNAWATGSGTAAGTAGGWTITGDGPGTVELQRVGDGYLGMHSSTHGFMVDMDASPGNVAISQVVAGLQNGQAYTLTFEAGSPDPASAALEVWFGGQLIFTIPTPSGVGNLTPYALDIVGGFGNGSNLLEFREVGVTENNHGTYLANVYVSDFIIVDETPGVDLDADDNPSLAGVFAPYLVAINPGTDPDMEPQFAAGTGSVVQVNVNFGSDGPNTSVSPLVYSLNVTNAVSGLQTTDGKAIQLFEIGDQIVVGRYDSNGDTVIDNSDNAAFAFYLDPSTGVLTVAQFVSLKHPITGASHDEGIFLNNGTLEVRVVATDGDFDTTTQTADISGKVRFEDDGPNIVLAQVVGGVTIDETPGIDAGSNDYAAAAAVFAPFAAINPGTDPDMPAQFASGSQSVLNLVATFGADGAAAAGSVAYSLNLGSVVSGLQTTEGKSITLVALSSNLIVGRYDSDGDSDIDANDKAAFAIHIDSGTGVISIAQYVSLYHPDSTDHDDSVILGLNANTLSVTVVVTDGDGDTATITRDITGTIKFEDDGPRIISVTANSHGPELIVNGSFESGHGLGVNDWEIFSSLNPGWTQGPDGIPFEVQTNGVGGLSPHSGNAYVELDSDTQGNPDNALPAATPGPGTNATIQQTVSGLVAGEQYELTFWYSPRGGDGVGNSGMDVSFGGVQVYSIPSDANLPVGWVQYTVVFTATSTSAVLAFTGTGTANEWGAFLDDVSLKALIPTLDDEDTTLSPAVEIQGGPGDDGSGVVSTGKINFDAGADGLRSIAASAMSGLSGIYVNGAGIGIAYAINQVWVPGVDASGGFAGYEKGGTLIGTMSTPDGSKTAFTLEIDSSGNYKFTLVAPLNHPVVSTEDNLHLDFAVTITDGDGDTATGKIALNVDDDSPEATANTVSVTVAEADITGGGVVTTAITSAFDGFNGQIPNLGNITLNAGSEIAFFVPGTSALQGPNSSTGSAMIVFTANPGTTFTVDSMAIGLFGANSGPQQVVLKGYDANGNVYTYTFNTSAVAFAAATPSTVFHATGTPLDGIALTKLELVPPSGLAGRIIVDNFAGTQSVQQPVVPVEATVDLANAAVFGADGEHAGGGFSLQSFTAQQFGAVTSDGAQVFIKSDGNVLTGYTGTDKVVFTLQVVNGDAVFKLYQPLDHNGGDVALEFGNFIRATDGDGDYINLGASAVVFNVESPNTPFVVGGFTATVEEEHLNPSLGTIAGETITAIGNEDSGNPALDADTSGNFNVVTNQVTGSFASLVVSGLDGTPTFGFAAGINGVQANFGGAPMTSGGQPVVYVVVGNTLYGYVEVSGAGFDVTQDRAVFALTVDPSNGNYTFSLLDKVDHTYGDNIETVQVLNLSGIVTITDSADGETVAFPNVGINIIDDSPVVTALNVAAPSITMDESIGVHPGDANAQLDDNPGSPFGRATITGSSIAGLFSSAAGADGLFASTFALVLKNSAGTVIADNSGTGAVSNLSVTGGGVIVLYHEGGEIVGHVNDASGAVALRVSINSVTGEVTVEQYLPIQHLLGGLARDDSATLDLTGSGGIFVNYAVTDGDGDKANATSNQALTIKIEDDGPLIAATGVIPTVTVDESFLGTDATVSFAPAFASNFGTDGAGTIVYTLGVSSSGAASGLVDTATGQNVVLTVVGNQVFGKTAISGETVFVISVDASANVTLDQQRAIVHPTTNPDESKSLSAGSLITLTGTITDGDGDISVATIAIGNAFVFKDDGVDAKNDTDSIGSAATGSNITGNVITGDGTNEGTGGTGTDVIGADGGKLTAIVSNNIGGGAVGIPVGGADIGGQFGGLHINPDGSYVYTRTSASAGTDTFTYTLTDGDGDFDTATLTINLLAVPSLVEPHPDQILTNIAAGSPVWIPVQGLLWNDTNLTDHSLTVVASSLTNGATLDPSGKFIIFTSPATLGVGSTFEYSLTDGTNTYGPVEAIVTRVTTAGQLGNFATSDSDFLIDTGNWGPITINGTDGNDVIVAGPGANNGADWNNDGVSDGGGMFGGAGNDLIFGANNSNNFIDGGIGNDTLIGGTSTTNWIHGGDGNDTIYGGKTNGTNYLFGDAGDDVIHILGNASAPTQATGGSGADTFVFSADSVPGWNHLITDYNLAEGDKIDLTEILNNVTVGADLKAAGYLKLDSQGLWVDANGGADGYQKVTGFTGGTPTAVNILYHDNHDTTHTFTIT